MFVCAWLKASKGVEEGEGVEAREEVSFTKVEKLTIRTQLIKFSFFFKN